MDLADSGSVDDSASTIDLGPHDLEDLHPKPKLDVIDDFQIEAELGHGGMGEVYLATERGLNRRVALKVLQAARRISSIQVKRFLIEAQAAAQLSHDHIVPIYHVGESNGIHYFTMRYIEGHDLSEIIRSAQRALRDESHASAETRVPSDQESKSKSSKPTDSTVKDQADSTQGRIDLSKSSFVGSQRAGGSRSAHKLAVSVALIGESVAEALQHAHEQGIIHRDIKPSNLMLDHTNKIWVTDFGLAQLQGAEDLTNTGDLVGTLRYMSPEQASGQRAFIDHRTDIYSLGVTLYELATLRKACQGERQQDVLRSLTFERPQPIRKINPKLPRDLETIICKATERNPSDRYQTAAELAADLRRFANNESLMARRPSQLKMIRNWLWDRPAIAAMGLAMLIVFSGSMAMVARTTGENNRILADENLKAQQRISLREGERLIGESWKINEEQSSLAIAAVLAGMEVAPGPDAESALNRALNLNHELKTIPFKFDFPGSCAVSSGGEYVVLCTDESHRNDTRQNALVIELKSGKTIGSLDSGQVVTAAAYFDSDRFLLTKAVRPQQPKGQDDPSSVLTVWDAKRLATLKSLPLKSTARISAANYSGVRRQLVVPNTESSATVLSVPGFETVMVLPRKHEQPVVDCVFSHDGSKIATWSKDGQLILWDANTGAELQRIPHTSKRPEETAIFFTADSKQICLSGVEGSRIIRLQGEQAQDYLRSERIVSVSTKNNLAFLLNGIRKSVLVLDTIRGEVLAECKADKFISGVTAILDDQFVATIQDEDVVVYNVRGGQQVALLTGHTDYVRSMAAVPGQEQLVSVGDDRTMRVWDIQSNLQRRTLKSKVELPGSLVASQSRLGNRALLGSIRVSEVWMKQTAGESQTLLNIKGEVVSVLSRDRILTSSQSDVTLWDSTTQKRLQQAGLPIGSTMQISQVIEVPESDWLALLTHDDELFFWNVNTSFVTPIRLTESEHVTGVAVNHSGAVLVASSTGELLTLEPGSWNRKSVTKLPFVAHHLKMHPTKNWLLALEATGSANVWDLDSDKFVNRFIKPDNVIGGAGFVGEDRLYTHSGLSSTELTLWSITDGKEVDSAPVQSVFRVDVNAHNDAIAVAAKNGALYWNIASQEKIQVSTEPARTVAFVGDKLIIATNIARVPLPTEKLIAKPVKLSTWNCQNRAMESSEARSHLIDRIWPLSDPNHYLVTAHTFGADCVELDKGNSLRELNGHLYPLKLASLSVSAREAVTVSSDGKILHHSIEDGAQTLIGTHDYPITASAISKDGVLLLTADAVDGIRCWDLQARKLIREVSVEGKSVTQLAISASNTTAIAQIGDDLIKYWDLRTWTTNDLKLDDNVQKAALSPDGQSLLVSIGKRRVYPAHPLETRTAMSGRKPPQLLVMKLFPLQRQQIELAGLVSDCQFVNNGKRIAVLSTLGLIQLYDSGTLKPIFSLEAPRRTMQLLEGPSDSNTVFAASKNKITAWSTNDGKRVREFDVSLSGFDATVHPGSLLPYSENQFYLFLCDSQFIKQPVDLEKYAKQVAPRTLSPDERDRLLNDVVR